jgi:hypothetical protein
LCFSTISKARRQRLDQLPHQAVAQFVLGLEAEELGVAGALQHQLQLDHLPVDDNLAAAEAGAHQLQLDRISRRPADQRQESPRRRVIEYAIGDRLVERNSAQHAQSQRYQKLMQIARWAQPMVIRRGERIGAGTFTRRSCCPVGGDRIILNS